MVPAETIATTANQDIQPAAQKSVVEAASTPTPAKEVNVHDEMQDGMELDGKGGTSPTPTTLGRADEAHWAHSGISSWASMRDFGVRQVLSP